MIEKIIELSIHNRFLVIILAMALTVAGIYATLNPPGHNLGSQACRES